MHDAPRCGALTGDGRPCRSPAVAGKKRCHVHGGKGSKGKTYRIRFSDYSKAWLERDRRIGAEVRNLARVIGWVERSGGDPDVIAEIEEIRRNLLRITQQKQTDLAASYCPPSADLTSKSDGEALGASDRQASAHPGRPNGAVRDRAVGAMLGLAVGEAVGLTLDGLPRDSYRPITDMFGGGRLGLKAGEWAGNTAMALALLDSLTFRRGFDETDFIERLVEWQEGGAYSCTGACIGLDATTAAALARYRQTGDPVAGDIDPDNLSNAILVRVAPVPILYWNRRTRLSDVAARQSRTTHAGLLAVNACVAFTEVLADAISGSRREVVLRPLHDLFESPMQHINPNSWENKRRSEIGSGDNVLKSLEAALWCVGRTNAFDDAVLLATNLGGDAGTTAALAGQLAGALYGASAIRADWLERVAWHDKIVERAGALFEQSLLS